MKSFFALALFGLVAVAYAQVANDDNDEEFMDAATSFDLYEVDEDNWDPIMSVMPSQSADSWETVEEYDEEEERGLFSSSKGDSMCSCSSGNSCGCCARPKIPFVGSLDACVNVIVKPEDKLVDVLVAARGKTLFEKAISTAKAERICNDLPGTLSGFHGCLYTQTKELPGNSGLELSASADITKGGIKIARVIFANVEFKDGKLSLVDSDEVKAKDMYKIKTANPFKEIGNMFG